MALTPGTRLGVYEVIASIGVGGMGEVYRATDTTLGRQVAIKILPDAFAADPERMARFEREAKTLASLNHPNIAAIYAVEKSAPSTGSGHAVMPALVMELVEGDDLSRRLAHGAIPIDEALPIAKQVTEALEAAHEQGIIHRDLKPANIKVRSDGAVKVLDFGLAKAMEPVGAMSPSVSMSPTITTPAMTQAGMILGTAAYMAPEQARGKTVDKRADIWAFGAVLYEMLTGRRAFDADDVSLTMARVLEREVDFDALPPAVPARVHQTLRMCLRKDSKQRIGDIRDVRLALEGAFETAAPQMTSSATSSTPRSRLAWMAALGVAVLGIIALAIPTVRHLRETSPPTPPETRLEIATPPTADPTSFALSPDGWRLVFVASGDGPSRLWLRPLDRVTAQPLAGTDGALRPFWSPDSRSVAFFANGTLKRLDIGSGPPQTLANAIGGGGSWSADGVILFAPRPGPLFRVPASGGEAVAVTTLAADQFAHTSPQFLPGGRRFLFYVMGAENAAGIYLGSLDAPDTQRVTAAETAGAFVPPDWLLFVRQGTLVAQRFDVARGALTGDPVSVADPVGVVPTPPRGAFSVSATGMIAYRAPSGTARQLTWFDRSGQVLGTLGARDENALWEPALSPDGRRVAVSRVEQGNPDVWLIDAARTTRFTFEAGNDTYPLWSPDGSRIVFTAFRPSVLNLYEKPSSGAGRETLLVESAQHKAATSWSRDGRFLLFNSVDPTTARLDVWVLPMQGDPKPWAFLRTNVNERDAQFSPDGRWVAYASDESGRFEIYVRPFAGPGGAPSAVAAPGTPGGQWQVSTAGGIDARWRPDGQALYYLAPDGTVMAAPIAAKETTFEPGTPAALFRPRIVKGGSLVYGQRHQYDVAPDGRFLINTELDSAAAPITLLTNWNPEAKK